MEQCVSLNSFHEMLKLLFDAVFIAFLKAEQSRASRKVKERKKPS